MNIRTLASIGLAAAITSLTCSEAAPQTSPAPLGSPICIPTPDRPIGWRGDGTGRYPGANPPVSWDREATDKGYTAKGIVWAAPLPNIGVSTPIIVGNRIFLTSEVSDLVCLDKQSGKILWIRSNPEFETVSEDERKAEPAYSEKLTPLLADLTKANAAVVEALNAGLGSALTAPSKKPDPALERKRDLEKKIQDEQTAIDKKRFGRDWRQTIFGFSGPTPTSDGKHVCAFFTTGVTACYDLEGNRLWNARGAGFGSEHGNFASPLLLANRLVVWANEMRGYDVATGKLLWTNPAKAFNTYGSLFRIQSGNDLVAAYQWGFFTRIRDGQPVWDQGVFGDSVTTPIVENGVIYARVGYPKNNDETKAMRAFKVPPDTDHGKLVADHEFKQEWADDELAVDKQKNPFDRGFVSSPLYVDGLLYQLTQGGGLLANDAATGALVYRKVLPLKPKTKYWDWSGCGASPTLAGKYIYLLDNQGNTLILQPGKEYREIGHNFIAESKDGKDQAQNEATPIFEGTRMYYRTPYHLFCVGDR